VTAVDHTVSWIRSRGRKAAAFALFALVLLTALALASSSRAAVESPSPPQVWSDKADYAPGETVTLSGANWAPGEAVHIRINDDAGETWRRDVDVTADESGAISDQFNLPDWFVAQYSVTATGASSGTATWSFTDANVSNINGSASAAEGSSGSYSANVTACNSTPCNYVWSVTAGNASITSGASGTVSANTTVSATLSFGDGPSSVTLQITASAGNNGATNTRTMAITVNNVAPTVTITGEGGPAEGATETYDYTVTDPGVDTVTVGTPSCGTGTLTSNMPNQSRFKCKFLNGPASTSVSLNATDDDTPAQTGTGTLAISVQNVSPTVTAASGQTATQGQSASIALGSFTDPGAEASWSVTVNWGDGSTNDTFTVAGNTSNAACSSPCTLGPRSHTYATTGSKTVTVTVNDGNGSASATFAVTVSPADAIAPTTTSTPTPAANGAGWNNTNVSVALSSTDNAGGSGVKEITYSASGAQTIASTTVAGGSIPAISVSNEGTTTLSFFAKDNAGNTEATKTLVVKIDKAAPDTSITANPSNPSNSSSASFSFSGTDPAPSSGGLSFECKLDAGVFASCTSPQGYSSLTDGSHTFQVRAKDAAGNVDASPASFTWTVDTLAPPTPMIVTGPSNPSNDSSPTFTFSDTEAGVGFLCRLDGDDSVPYVACTSPQSYSGVADGEHTFFVKAKDAAGNTSGANAFTWTIDTLAPPTPSIDTFPASLSNDDSPSFTFSDSEAGVSFRCDLDGAGFSACSSPQDYGDLEDGEHTFSVKAKDAAGNFSDAATYTWTIDATPPPAPVITDAPTALSNDMSPTFTFTEDEAGTSLFCMLDYAGYEPCASPQEYTGVGDGEHTFHVKAVDAAGNEAATFMVWTIDAMPPTLTASAVQGTDPTFGDATAYTENDWTNQDVKVEFQCSDDEGGSGVAAGDPTPSSQTFTTEGAHSASSDCSDNAGNSVSTSFGVKIDKTPPTIVATLTPAPNADGWNNTDVTVSFACADALSGLNDAYGNDGVGCWSDELVTTEGLTTFVNRTAFDNAGNSASTSPSVRIDKTKPTSSATSPAYNNSPTIHVSYTASDGGPSGLDSVELWVKGPGDAGYSQAGTDSSGAASGSFDYDVPTDGDGNLVDGTYRFYTIAVDKADNRENTPSTPDGSTTQTVQDSVDPDTSIGSHPSDPSNSSSASFSFTHTDADPSSGLARFECSLDGAAFATCSSPRAYSSLAEGSHSFEVRAVDNAQNTDESPASFSWFVDTVAPDTITDTHPADPTNSTAASFSFHATDASPSSGIAGFECKLDSGGYGACTSPQTYSGLADGSHTFSVRASDNAGNQDASPASFTWLVDTVKPVISGSQSPPANAAGWNKGDVAVSFTCADVGPNASGIQFDSVAGATLTHEGRNQSVTNSGDCVDNAGNHADSKTVSGIKIDKTSPIAPTSHVDHGPEYSAGGVDWYSDNVQVSFTSNGDPDLEDLTAGSGVASVTGAQTFSSAGSFSKSGKVTDQAGNDSTAVTVSGNVDTQAPAVTLACPTGTILLGAPTSANWSASDPGGASAASGVKAGFGSGSVSLDTSTPGAHTAQVPAGASKDNVGHLSAASNSCDYSVLYNFIGFLQPVDNKMLNGMKAGSTAPIKWQLKDAAGNYVSTLAAVKTVSSGVMACDASTPVDNLEEYATGGTTLRYDSAANQYIYNWQSPKQVGKCYQVKIVLIDNTVHAAMFQLK
jgi:hypothetical protein